ncbi:hypothetical protein Tsubulata_038389 [Turnera subulata]|uniref:Phospholipid/glycerol acyltransferase domain-containing protein n=1 Tax=Turnera subulata TaxID=218843 RepID=A0A9Q0G8I2_9ROSI|nr:hypothetical protein Tsubulata_038389 [Turnera subulata]
MPAVQRIERGDLWKLRARQLQLRLRDRFRVAVDRHRPPIFSPDSSFSSTVQRWLARFRDFRRESLQSPSAFYRKRGTPPLPPLPAHSLTHLSLSLSFSPSLSIPVSDTGLIAFFLFGFDAVSKDFNGEEESVIMRMLQSVAVPLLGNMCYVFMHGLNSVQVYGVEKLHEALLRRPKDKPLLTVSNHVASVDDPFVIASLLPPNVMLDAQNLRWTLCATDRCFKNPVTSAFFKSVKVLPLSRGDGIYQKGMDMAIAKLNSGGWVHIFPEGSRSRDGGKTIGSAKRGVGRLVLDADTIPIVIPFVHIGMQEIMPIGASLPKIGKTVTVLVGDPIHFDDLLSAEGNERISRGKLYDAVASRIGVRLRELKVQVEKLVVENSIRLQRSLAENTEEADNMVPRVDWDSFGTGGPTAEKDAGRDGIQLAPAITNQRKPICDLHSRIGCSYEGGIVSRIRSFMDPSDLVLFSARGLFMNHFRQGACL